MANPEPGRFSRLLDRVRGVPIAWDPPVYRRGLSTINAYEAEVSGLTDDELASRFRRSVADPILGFAIVREAANRTVGLRPHDEQILTGLALFDGNVVEMQTGEGKTLAAVAPLALRALEGRGAHLLTFNDYLARRDAAWMGPIYRLLGLSVGVIQEGMPADERRAAYAADLTYATAKEVGFDTLRASLIRRPEERVLRPFHSAIIDEADSILIDEARVPLVIAGEIGRRDGERFDLAGLISSLEPGTHFGTDEHRRNAHLTDDGYRFLERELDCGGLIETGNLDLLTEIHCALHARVLLRRDVDYIVHDGRIELVDEFTGRTVEDRHLPDGLQAAVEAKEGLRRGAMGAILGSVTLQHFLGGYPTLAGMTATARTSAHELKEFYGLSTVVVPSHRPSIRADQPDLVFTDRQAKNRALVEEIQSVHATGRPILVGTASVEESESLARDLHAAGVKGQVLNARRDEQEAAIIAEAGAPHAVTISTNMAGRGTDIRLGGRDERERERVVALGGLYVVGTNRHESRRIDDQLRGRAGRQGDPGSSRFFVSLEDPLIARYGVRRLIPDKHRPAPQEAPLDHPVIVREIERAQRIVDGENVAIRRTLTRYTTMVEEQRAQIDERRRAAFEPADETSMLAARATERHRDLERRWGRAAVAEIERQITLACIDRSWCEHLAHVADLRDSIHLMRVARLDPLAEFQKAIIEAWAHRWQELDDRIVEIFERVRVGPDGADLEGEGLQAPTSTWTYLVSDDPFRDKLMSTMTGTAMGLGIVFNFPLVLAWWIYVRYFWKKRRRNR